MEINTIISNGSDDEDLDFLRLNALNTLKRPPVPVVSVKPAVLQNSQTQHHFNKSHKSKKFNKGFGGIPRGTRNSPYNRVRNSNLISVQTVETEQPDDFATNIKISPKLINQPAKLILPQDRYCSTSTNIEDKNDSTSKFDRYNNSDNSESDSDEEKMASSSDKEIKRSKSLEDLMKALETEIQGGDKPSEVKTESITKIGDKKLETVESKSSNDEEEDKVEKAPVVITKIAVEVEKKPFVKNNNFISTYNNSPSRGLSQNMHTDRILHQIPYIEPSVPHITTFPPAVPYTNMNVPYDQYGYPMAHRPMDVLQNVQPPSNVRLSPLHINTDILNTITAPLSPRSAAFVLQNREIIERRKKSPRRSYSRSPTPEFRRSLSPRYRRLSKSPSPLRNNRRSPLNKKLNPRRLSPNVRRLSPNTLVPLRRSPKQIRKSSERSSPIRSHRSPLSQNNIRNRLGVPSTKFEDKRFRNRSSSISLSPSPERITEVKPESHINAVADPVLEARRRKFEEKNTPITAGIIRLKPPKPDESDLSNSGIDEEKADTNMEEEKEVEGTEDVGVDDSYIDFDLKVDLFSDEESDDENEGRFKLNNEQKNKVAVLPFSQLMNGTSKTIEKGCLLGSTKRSHDRDREHRDRKNKLSRNDRYRSEKDRSKRSPEKSVRYKEERNEIKSKNERQKSRSPLRAHVSNSNEEKRAGASEVPTKTINSEKRSPKGAELPRPVKFERRKSPIVSPIESRKIEIKIRHPSKYEEPKKDKEISKSNIVNESVKSKKIGDRKVEVARNLAIDNEDGEIVEDELEVVEHKHHEDDVLIKTDVSGDLRAQLSRKRAERQNKVTKVEILPSRLLQNALQGAVFKKKSKKSKSKKSDKEAAPLDDVEASVFAGVGRTAAKVRDYGVSADINCNAVKKDRKVRVVHKITELVPASTDGKLPIHLRLGVPGGNVDLFSDPKSHSNKRIKNRGSLEQVLYLASLLQTYFLILTKLCLICNFSLLFRIAVQ